MRIISLLIIFICVSVLTRYLKSYSKKSSIDRGNGYKELKLSKLFLIVGLVCIVFGGILIALLPIEDGDLIYVILIEAFLLGGGLLLILFYFNEKVLFSEDKVITYDLFNKSREIEIKDISEIKFSNIFMEIKLRTNYQTVKFSVYLRGVKELIGVIERKVDSDKYMDSFNNIHNYK